jgi:Phospholipid-translocating ATPase N-terminal
MAACFGADGTSVRRVRAGDAAAMRVYGTNAISNTKYTWWSFLFLTLWEQFGYVGGRGGWAARSAGPGAGEPSGGRPLRGGAVGGRVGGVRRAADGGRERGGA